MSVPAIVALLFALGAPGCRCGDGSPSREQRAEAGRLSHAIDRLRQAPNAGKAVRLAELERLPCSAPPSCETRAVCASAYELHVGATEALERVRRVGEAAPAELSRLEQQLERARRAMRKCVAAQAALKTEFGVE